MHKLCIYKNPGGWICEDLNHRGNNTTHSNINSLVNEKFSGFGGFLRKHYGSDFSNTRMNMIKDYLKIMFKHYQIVFLDFPGNLETGELINDQVHPLNAATNFLFRL